MGSVLQRRAEIFRNPAAGAGSGTASFRVTPQRETPRRAGRVKSPIEYTLRSGRIASTKLGLPHHSVGSSAPERRALAVPAGPLQNGQSERVQLHRYWLEFERTVRRDLARHRRRRPIPPRDRLQRLATRETREISSRSANDNRNRDRTDSLNGGRRNRATYPPPSCALDRSPCRSADSATPSPPTALSLASHAPTTAPLSTSTDRANPIESAAALIP
jgi:hypothetical protein